MLVRSRNSGRELLLRSRRNGLRALALLLLGDARTLAAQAAQVIELGAAHLAAAHDLDRVDHRRIERKHALDALAIGNLAHGEVLVEPGAGAPDAHALIGLDAAALAFHYLVVDDERVARLEIGNGFAGGKFRHLLLFELFDQVHRASPSAAPEMQKAHVGVVVWNWRASTPLRELCHPSGAGFLAAPARARCAAQRSGRRSRVSRSASCRRQAATLA